MSGSQPKESQLKVNSLKLRFTAGSQEPTDPEIFQFMRGKMKLKPENLLSMYKDRQDNVVIIKFKNEEEYKSTMQRLPGTMEFAYNKYQSTQVHLSPANAVVKYVRLFNLPPEVEDGEIWAVLSKYGKVQRTVREKYGDETGFPIWTSVRGAYVELKEGTEIPATVFVRNLRSRVYYEGLINKCFQCGATDHIKADCPQRKSVNSRMDASRGTSYSEAVTGGAPKWTKPKTSEQPAKTPEGTMTNLNALFPAAPEKRKQCNLETVSSGEDLLIDLNNEQQPGSSKQTPGEHLLTQHGNVPENQQMKKEKTTDGGEWQIVPPKKWKKKRGDARSSSVGAIGESSESISVESLRRSERLSRPRIISPQQGVRSRSRSKGVPKQPNSNEGKTTGVSGFLDTELDGSMLDSDEL